MNRYSLLLAASLLAVAGCAVTAPGGSAKLDGRAAPERANSARVSFHVTGMKKTRSGAT